MVCIVDRGNICGRDAGGKRWGLVGGMLEVRGGVWSMIARNCTFLSRALSVRFFALTVHIVLSIKRHFGKQSAPAGIKAPSGEGGTGPSFKQL